MKNLPRIYLDMDGVLCDFGAAIRKATGKSKEAWIKIPSNRKWDTVIDTPKFWENMPWNTPGKVLYNFVKKYNPHILSAYLEKTFDPNCIPGKRAWLRKNARITDRSKINLVRRKEKKNFATKGGQKNILIDDYEKNVREFINAGGMGIVHKDYLNTIQSLKRLGIQ